MSIPTVMAGNTIGHYRGPVTKITNSRRKASKPLTPEQAAICQRLRQLWDARKDQLGLTQESVANAMKRRDASDGITQGAIGHFLTGRKAVPIDRIFWFAELLRVHPLDIDPNLKDRLPPLLGDLLENIKPAAHLHRSTQYPSTASAGYRIQER